MDYPSDTIIQVDNIIKNSPKIDIILNNLATPTELASCLLFIQALKNINKQFELYIPNGIKLRYMQDLIQERQLNYKIEIKPLPFIVEIQGGASKVKDLRVDIKDGKLIVYLVPNQEDFSAKDVRLIEGKTASDYFVAFGYSSFQEFKEKVKINLKLNNNAYRIFMKHKNQSIDTNNLLSTLNYDEILKFAAKNVPNNQVPHLWKILITYLQTADFKLNYTVYTPLGYQNIKELRKWVETLKKDHNIVVARAKYKRAYQLIDIHPESAVISLLKDVGILINIIEINGYKLVKLVSKKPIKDIFGLYNLRGTDSYLETIVADDITFINDLVKQINLNNTLQGYTDTDKHGTISQGDSMGNHETIVHVDKIKDKGSQTNVDLSAFKTSSKTDTKDDDLSAIKDVKIQNVTHPNDKLHSNHPSVDIPTSDDLPYTDNHVDSINNSDNDLVKTPMIKQDEGDAIDVKIVQYSGDNNSEEESSDTSKHEIDYLKLAQELQSVLNKDS